MNSLNNLGRNVIHCPAFCLQAVDPEFGDHQLSDTVQASDWIIVVSPMAARRTLECVDAALLTGCRIITPGPATASAFVEQGLDVVIAPVPGTSEVMLSLPELQQITAQRILIIAAPGGRSLLAETLSSRAALVQRLVLYRREPLAPSQDFLRLLDDMQSVSSSSEMITLLSSAISFQHICKCLNASQRTHWLNAHWIVSSERLKKIVCDAGARSVQLAVSAADLDMLRALDERTRS